jgi:predicted tellurium resistance membrane protein TerC
LRRERCGKPGCGPRLEGLIVGQTAVVDILSIDSIVTAIGMAQEIRIMIAAVLIAVVVMYAAARPIARFIAAYPTTKTQALAFLMLIVVALVADGFDAHIVRGYVYFAMAFAAAVEPFNIWAARFGADRETGPENAFSLKDRAHHRRRPRYWGCSRAACCR